jgi:hypothetical protein
MTNKYMKKCSKWSTIREMQIKSSLRFHLPPVRIAIKHTRNAGKDVGVGGRNISTLLVGT